MGYTPPSSNQWKHMETRSPLCATKQQLWADCAEYPQSPSRVRWQDSRPKAIWGALKMVVSLMINYSGLWGALFYYKLAFISKRKTTDQITVSVSSRTRLVKSGNVKHPRTMTLMMDLKFHLLVVSGFNGMMMYEVSV